MRFVFKYSIHVRIIGIGNNNPLLLLKMLVFVYSVNNKFGERGLSTMI